MPDYITYELSGDIALIGIDRAEKRNAMTRDMFDEIGAAARRAGEEAKVGIIFSHGANFSAGLDLVDTAEKMAKGEFNPDARQRNRAHSGFDAVARGKIPFIAALNGAVIGAGLELAAAAHVRVADPTTYFGLPEGLRGIFVGGGGSVNIQRLVGYATMADMMLTRRRLSAKEGVRCNLVQYLVDDGQARDKAIALAKVISDNPPMSNWAICNLLPRVADLNHDDGLFLEQMGAHYVLGRDSEQRLQDFAQKRAKKFTDAQE